MKCHRVVIVFFLLIVMVTAMAGCVAPQSIESVMVKETATDDIHSIEVVEAWDEVLRFTAVDNPQRVEVTRRDGSVVVFTGRKAPSE